MNEWGGFGQGSALKSERLDIEGEGIGGESAPQNAGIGKGFRCPFVESAVVEQPKAVGQLEGDFEVVGGEQDGLLLLPGDAAQKAEGFDLGREVQESRGLVEQDEGRGLRQSPRNHGTLPLAIAQGGKWAVGKGEHAAFGHGSFHRCMVDRAEATEPRGVRSPPQRHELGHGEEGRRSAVGEDEGKLPCPLLRRELRHHALSYPHFAAQRFVQSGQGAQQGAFPTAVAPHQGGERPRRECGGEGSGEGGRAVPDGQLLKLQHGDAKLAFFCGSGFPVGLFSHLRALL